MVQWQDNHPMRPLRGVSETMIVTATTAFSLGSQRQFLGDLTVNIILRSAKIK